ncbi:hypothetical protein B0H63DRAFT_95838 [Podospora didyma]|uniref:Zn(2)-C6 fungal-type domain-containing protein n=1 Tax=Podospora didyma TaxID=330526 RepID=A0AAE0NXG5_9PEZI|nr:hypothetical protein B0H63DRAFT_95838 [Podospora didyma]
MPSKTLTRADLFMPSGTFSMSKSSREKTGKAGGPCSLVFTLDHRPRATRASVPKVRSGCITCKRRHVKCDEEKPSCRRCTKWQGFCDGYGPSSPSPSKSDRSHSPASPKAEPSSPAPSSSTNVQKYVRGPTSEPISDSGVFESGWEKTYFDRWLAIADTMGGGWFHMSLFSDTIPQLSGTELAIRYAAMAVGALATALAPNGSTSSPTASLGNSPHYKVALTYHGQALRLVRLQQDLNSESTLRVAVIACILFACFETLHDSADAAVEHINHGLMIVEQFMRAQNVSKESRESFVLEDEILQVFQRLNYLSWSTGLMDRWQETSRICLRTSGIPSYHDLPDVFSDLVEARRWWDLVQHWALDFPRSAAVMLNAEPSSPANLFSQRNIYDNPELRGMQCQHLNMLEQWHTAFFPIYLEADANKDVGPLPFFQAISILLQYDVLLVCIRSVCFSDRETLQAMTPQFREIVRLGSIIVSNQPKVAGSAEVFTMDNGPTFSLFMAATKCSDSTVRAEALTLLKTHPRRDAFWDSRTLVRRLESGVSSQQA